MLDKLLEQAILIMSGSYVRDRGPFDGFKGKFKKCPFYENCAKYGNTKEKCTTFPFKYDKECMITIAGMVRGLE